ncbi:succinyl-CoA ligase subunit alpha [Aureobasidium subglaciale]|nr:succinyl-CoA ligase subunit alpha [Aureobasidium subglaciale]
MPVPRSTPNLIRSSRTRLFSSSAVKQSYEDTVQNLKIGKHTRVLYQGFTGKVATQNAKESIEYGTNIVGGVKPGGSADHLGLPVLSTVREAKEQLKPDATAIYVAAPHAGKAIEEAIEAEVPLIVAVAEHIPLHDILRIMSILKTQSKSRLVGANAPGIISAIGKCRIGFQPLPTFSPGHIGIVAKSGTLSYETVASITRAGLGQSLCIGMGGDVVAGTNFVDALRVFETDADTEAIVLVGEVGGSAELEAAEWIKDYHSREKNPKPIAAVVGGRMAPPGRVMGHAGAWAGVGEATAEEKYKILQNAGVTMVDHPEKFGNVMKTLLKQAGKDVGKIQQSAVDNQRRSMHTARRLRPAVPKELHRINTSQQRSLHLRNQKAVDHLSKSLEGFTISEETPNDTDSVYLSISVDRSSREPCIIASPSTNPRKLHHRLRRFPYSYLKGPDQTTIQVAIEHLQLDVAPPAAHAQTAKLISRLAELYREQEAVSLAVNLSVSSSGSLHLSQPQLFYDDAAFKSNKRRPEVHALRDVSQESAVEVEAEKSGIVFVKLHPDDDSANIGTLVNGAGLAMNTVDALALPPHNGKCANFLDTGGKATSETVKTSFELILKDPRVKVIFVNIFGGLTDCGMIADGVIMAFEKVDMQGKPVVVRLRGTNEEVGQKKIAESGLPLEAFDGFHEAAQRVVELTQST